MNGNDSKAMRRLPCTCRAAEQVLWFDEVDSTNTVARRLLTELTEAWRPAGGADAAIAAPPIAGIVADAQTAGQGRLGRRWVSVPGESSMVSFTTVLPQSLATDPHVNGWLQMIAGLAAAEAIDDVCARIGAACTHTPSDGDASPATSDADGDGPCALMLKWPNDIVLHGRKLGGILLELVTPLGGAATAGSGAIPRADVQSRPSGPDGGRMVGLVIGVGINLAIPADRLPTELATSLQLHRAPLPDPERMRDLIAAGMAASLRSRLREFIADPVGYAAALRDEMTSKCWTIGRRVEARLVDGGTVRGTAMRLNVDASLMVRDAGGYEHTITTGDVGVL